MRLVLVTDSPRISRSTDRYISLVCDSVAKASGKSITPLIVAAVLTPQATFKEPALADIRAARPDLIRRIEDCRPDMIVSMGTAALNALAGGKTAVSLKGEHGRMRRTDDFSAPWVPTVAPWRVVKDSDLHRDFANVIFKAATQSEPLPEMDIDLHVVTSVGDLVTSLALLEGASAVSCDVETTGLSAYRDSMLALGLGATYDDDSGVAVVVPKTLLALLADSRPGDKYEAGAIALEEAVWRRSRRTVGHNFKFDMQFLAGMLGWPPRGALLGDTLLLAHLLDERPSQIGVARVRGSGLKDLVAQRYDFQYGFDFTGDYANENLDDMYAYLGKDVCYTARLWHDLAREADAESTRIMECHDTLLMPASVTIARCEAAGAPVDPVYVSDVVAMLHRRITRRQAALERAVLPIALTMKIDNVLSPIQVANLMYDEWQMTPDVRKHGQVVIDDRGTDKDHIEAAVAKYEHSSSPMMRQRAHWLRSLAKLRKDVKTKTTYVQSIASRIDADERLRASFLLHGASTGRLSSREPNLQNIPAVHRVGSDAKWPMRRAFKPKGDRRWVEADYSQLELRVAAAISGDTLFGDVFRSKRDVHREIASSIFSKPPDQIKDAERFLAKSVSFGILYGRTAKAIAGGSEMDYAVRELGMTRWTPDQAQAFINKFLKSYPSLNQWIIDTHTSVLADGYVESPFGRRRRFPFISDREQGSIMRQGVNTPIQSAASDICLQAMTRIDKRIADEFIDATVLFPVHDSICIEVVIEDIDRLREVCKQEMEQDFMGVPLTIDFEDGPTWADTENHYRDIQ